MKLICNALAIFTDVTVFAIIGSGLRVVRNGRLSRWSGEAIAHQKRIVKVSRGRNTKQFDTSTPRFNLSFVGCTQACGNLCYGSHCSTAGLYWEDF